MLDERRWGFRSFLPTCLVLVLLRPLCLFAQYSQFWTQQCGAGSPGLGQVVAADSSGNGIYVAGYNYGDLNGQTNSGNSDFVLLKYNFTGSLQWTRLRGSSGNDFAYGGKCRQ